MVKSAQQIPSMSYSDSSPYDEEEYTMVKSAQPTPSVRHSDSSSSDEEINLYFKITKTIAMKAKRSDTIKNLKVMLQQREGVSEDVQELYFAGDHLRDDHRILDYDIPINSTVHLVHGESSRIKLYFRMPSNEKIIALEMHKGDTIRKIKSIIHDKEGICPFDFEIYFSGKLLENHRTVASLNIKRGDTLHMISNRKDTRSISAKTPSGGAIEVEVRWTHIVLDVKKIIESMINIPSQCMKLFIAGTEEQLEDCMALAFYDIDEDDVLRIQIPDQFQISVKYLIGKTFTLDVSPSFTVLNVKELFSHHTKIPVALQQFKFNGRLLEDSRTLDSHGIGKESILHMVLSLRG